jgi:hypothetical protein
MQQIFSDGLTSLRWYDPDQVQRVVLIGLSVKNTPSDRVGSRLFHISHKSRIIDVKIKKSTIHIMYSTPLRRIFILFILIGFTGCATGPTTINPYFEMPPDSLPNSEQELFSRALFQLKTNHPDDSIKLWKRFLRNNPRSFKGYNNLGMAHYSNDQLQQSITAFETALALEPFDLKIKENLKRSLRFQITILRENKENEKAIKLLQRVKKLTDDSGKEKVALEIEQLQDLVFLQVKRANTLEQYESFLEKYPDNPIYADEARRQIAKMKPQEAPLGKFPEMQDELIPAPGQRPGMSMQEEFLQEPLVPEPMESVPALPPREPIQKETIEIVAETQKPAEDEEDFQGMGDPVIEAIPEPPKPRAMKKPKMMEMNDEPAVDPGMEMKRETSSMASPPPKASPIKRVRIMTRSTPLRVRAQPDAKSGVVAQVPRNSIVPVFQENKNWYQIDYQRGKKGWIAKKYTKVVP